LFDAVAQQLEENRRRQREHKKGSEHLLSGLVVCHRCGSAYCGRRQKRKSGNNYYVYYRCIGTDRYRFDGETICNNKSVNGQCLEQSVWSDLCDLLRDPERLRNEFHRRLEPSPNEDFDGAHRKRSIATLKRRINRLIDAYENGWLDKGEVEPRIVKLKNRLTREEETLAAQNRALESENELRLLIAEFDDFSRQIAQGLEDADFETKRNLLKLLIKRIEVDENEVRIVYKVQPRPFAPSPASRGRAHPANNRKFLQDWLVNRIGPPGQRQTPID
jgi:site-specific DNA recombinase